MCVLASFKPPIRTFIQQGYETEMHMLSAYFLLVEGSKFSNILKPKASLNQSIRETSHQAATLCGPLWLSVSVQRRWQMWSEVFCVLTALLNQVHIQLDHSYTTAVCSVAHVTVMSLGPVLKPPEGRKKLDLHGMLSC